MPTELRTVLGIPVIREIRFAENQLRRKLAHQFCMVNGHLTVHVRVTTCRPDRLDIVYFSLNKGVVLTIISDVYRQRTVRYSGMTSQLAAGACYGKLLLSLRALQVRLRCMHDRRQLVYTSYLIMSCLNPV